MKTVIKAALYASACLSAQQAAAASVYVFDFETIGYGQTSTIMGIENGIPQVSYEGINNPLIRFVFPASGEFQDYGNGQFVQTVGGSPNVLSSNGVSAASRDRAQDPANTIAANACIAGYAAAATPALGIFTADPTCGKASISFANSMSATRFDGSVTRLAIYLAESDSVVGGPFINGVPEPSTWALMLAGFGLTGYALRRRRAVVARA